MSDDEFLAAFEGCTIPKAEWTHGAHVRMAWLYAARSESYRAARVKVRAGIKRLNQAFAAQSAAPCGAAACAHSRRGRRSRA